MSSPLTQWFQNAFAVGSDNACISNLSALQIVSGLLISLPNEPVDVASSLCTGLAALISNDAEWASSLRGWVVPAVLSVLRSLSINDDRRSAVHELVFNISSEGVWQVLAEQVQAICVSVANTGLIFDPRDQWLETALDLVDNGVTALRNSPVVLSVHFPTVLLQLADHCLRCLSTKSVADQHSGGDGLTSDLSRVVTLSLRIVSMMGGEDGDGDGDESVRSSADHCCGQRLLAVTQRWQAFFVALVRTYLRCRLDKD